MKIAIVGSGGREHALAWKCARSPQVEAIYCLPGNGGVVPPWQAVPIEALDVKGVRDFALREKIDLVVIGPDDALAQGMADKLIEAGVRCFGPTERAARLESSKAYAKDFMERHGLPCARSRTFTEAAAARAWCRELSLPVVIKADGLALGKGVVIATTWAEVDAAIGRMMEEKIFGPAGERVVIEEFLEGTECSLHAFVSNGHYVLCPDARDHKRVGEGDTGPNTGGMGTISPSGAVDAAVRERIEREIMEPFVRGLAAEGVDFRGLLFPGLMLTATGPKVLEFNCRFGDPETQSLMRRLDSDLVELLVATAEGRLETVQPVWSAQAAACVVLVNGGYPGAYEKGAVIEGLDEAAACPEVEVFHAGTRREGGVVRAVGGRVLGVTALGADLPEARARAYAGARKIHFVGMAYRRDIGGPILPEASLT